MNQEFIKNAEKITTFNIPTAQFTSLEFKTEIQYLFNKHFFPDHTGVTVPIVQKELLNTVISELKAKYFLEFKYMHNYKPVGIGPGEISLYYLVDSSRLGGPNSAGCDLVDAETSYEIKAAAISNNKEAYSFELGREVNLTPLIKEAQEFKAEVLYEHNEISTSDFKVMKDADPKRFMKLESAFRDMAYSYFKKHKTIFINNSAYSPCGNIEAIKYVQPEDISIYKLSRNTIQPKVKL